MSPLDWLLEGTLTVGGSAILVREVVGNGFGLASAVGGMRRRVWAWPVGIVGNLVLFTVFVGGILDKPQVEDLWGQAGRQVFFLAVSLYGWWRWLRSRRAGESPDRRDRADLGRPARLGRARGPRRPRDHGLLLRAPGARLWGPLPDAWILTGSILATYGMARGWIEFWLVWIAVDVVGVRAVPGRAPPSAVLYLVYGGFCVAGFVTWVRVHRRTSGTHPTTREKVAA